jgi:predicted component of type VI protein secretion system
MELKLVVLAGAKEGTQIPLKKDKFIIGRASECTLRAGSSAISRRHCAIVRKESDWIVRDLGSRNGTFLNDTKVETPTPLKIGDQLRVGPLHFRVEQYVKSAGGSKVSKAAPDAQAAQKTTAEQDINRAKQPPVKDIAEVVQRTASKGDGSTSEDDISRWLLGIDAAAGGDMLRETQTLSMEDTTSISRAAPAKQVPTVPAANGNAEDEEAVDIEEAPAEKSVEGSTDKADSGGWKFFKMGKKGAAKKAPGKLPPRPAETSKDSREAAADILREMTRRR